MERHTRQREAVLAALVASPCSLAPPEICRAAQVAVPRLNLSTVYRQLKDLLEEGLVQKVDLPGQASLFEATCAHSRNETAHHHHHFHCTSCARVFPIHACPGPMHNLAPTGFRVEHHDLTLHGLCAQCLDTKDDHV